MGCYRMETIFIRISFDESAGFLVRMSHMVGILLILVYTVYIIVRPCCLSMLASVLFLLLLRNRRSFIDCLMKWGYRGDPEDQLAKHSDQTLRWSPFYELPHLLLSARDHRWSVSWKEILRCLLNITQDHTVSSTRAPSLDFTDDIKAQSDAIISLWMIRSVASSSASLHAYASRVAGSVIPA